MQNLARNKIIYKNTSSVLFIFAIAARLLYIIFSPLKDTDYELVHIAADNLISGNGLSYPRTYLNDLSLIYHDPMRYWPPLTALMVAFVKWLTESNQAADLILLFAGMISLFLVLKKLVVGFEVIPLFQIMIWLALATNPEPFRSIGISDLYGCLFLLWGLSFCIDYNSIAKSSKARLVFLSLVFFLPAAFRYQYYPVIFVLPIYFILTGVVLKKTTLLYKGLFSLFLVFCFLCLQLILLSVYTNSALFLYNDTKGFFPANLVMMYPLLLKTIINSSYIENLFINNLLWIKYSYLIASSFVLIVFFYFTAVFFSKKLFFIKKSPFLPVDKKKTLSFFLVFLTCSAVILSLVAVSLRYANRDGHFGGWTYVYEGRYYMAPALILLIVLIKFLQEKLKQLPFLKVLLCFIFLYNFSLWCKYVYNISTDNLSKTEVRNIAERALIGTKILELQKDPLPVIVSYKEPYFAFFFIKKNYAITKKVSVLIDSGFKTTSPVQLLIITNDPISEKEASFLLRNNATRLYTDEICSLYYIRLQKNTSSK